MGDKHWGLEFLTHRLWRVWLGLALGLLGLLSPVCAEQAESYPSKAQTKVTKIADNFYLLNGQGATSGALIGKDGVFMVDTDVGSMAEKTAAALKALTPNPLRYIVNTHVHPDHTGGNEYFGRAGVTIIGREEVRLRLAHPSPHDGKAVPPTTPAGLPTMTYRNRLTLYFDSQEVQLIAVPRAHTDGDTIVYFPGLDIIMTGDVYRSTGYPNVDHSNGGSLAGLLHGLGEIIGRAGPNTKLIPGHGPVVDRTAVVAERDIVLKVRDRVTARIAQGQSEEDVVAARVTADLDPQVVDSATTARRFVEELYEDLTATR